MDWVIGRGRVRELERRWDGGFCVMQDWEFVGNCFVVKGMTRIFMARGCDFGHLIEVRCLA